MTVVAFELSHTHATLPEPPVRSGIHLLFVGIMAVASTAVRRQNESGEAAHRVLMQLLLGSQSCLARAPFCCSIRYRVVRKKTFLSYVVGPSPPFPPYTYKVGTRTSTRRVAHSTLKPAARGRPALRKVFFARTMRKTKKWWMPEMAGGGNGSDGAVYLTVMRLS